MDENPESSAAPSTHLANLASLSVSVPCKTPSDALVTTLSVALSDDLSSNVLNTFLALFRDPAFSSNDVTFQNAQDISRHISEQRKRVAQKRSLAIPSSSSNQATNGNWNNSIYGGVPPIIVDLVAQQLEREVLPFEEQVDWDSNMFNATEQRCVREKDLLSMALVHRTWTSPVSRVLRSGAKLVGSKQLQAFLRTPRMGTWLREIYFVESLENENVSEMVRLLQHLLRNAPNVRKLCIRTWWRLGTPHRHDYQFFVREIGHMRNLEALWLYPNRGHVSCLPALCEVLPNLSALKELHMRNWGGVDQDEEESYVDLRNLIETTSSAARLTTLSFVDGGLNESAFMFLPWLLRDCPLTNLEVHSKDICRLQNGEFSPLVRALRPFLSNIKTMRMHYSSLNDDRECRAEFMRSCTSLKNLSLVVGLHHEVDYFPESIENLHVHFSTVWPVSGKQLCDILNAQQSLTKLRIARLTKDPVDVVGDFGLLMDQDEQLDAAWHIDDLKMLCTERKIDLTNEYNFISFNAISSW